MSKASAAVHDEVPKRAEVRALIESGDDFGHELRVGRILTAAGLRPTHGGTYVDPQTSKNREFDYRAAFWKNPGEVIRLAIECKNLRNSAPLIVCGLPRSRDDAYHHFVCANNGSSAATSAFMADIRKLDGTVTIYERGAFVGKSLIRAKPEDAKLVVTKDSEIYERWSQAISSAHELLTLAFNGETDTRTTGQKVFTAVLPAVVVPNGSLWTATYNADGKLMEDPKQADEAQYFVGQSSKSNPKFIFSHIHFLTMNGLSAFLGRMNSEDFYERVINRAAGRA